MDRPLDLGRAPRRLGLYVLLRSSLLLALSLRYRLNQGGGTSCRSGVGRVAQGLGAPLGDYPHRQQSGERSHRYPDGLRLCADLRLHDGTSLRLHLPDGHLDAPAPALR